MKYIFIILICFLGIAGYSQPIQPRANGIVTVLDSNLFTGKALRVPVFLDTTVANTYKTLDSSGKIIYTYSGNTLWYRSVQHKWILVGSGGGSTQDTVWVIPPLYSNETFDSLHISEASPDSSGYLSSGNFVYFSAKPDSVVTNSTGDSLFNYVAGVVTYAGKINGGSGIGTLQQSFDAAPTASPTINAGVNSFSIDSTSYFFVRASDGTGGESYLEILPGTGAITSLFSGGYSTTIEAANGYSRMASQTPMTVNEFYVDSNFTHFYNTDSTTRVGINTANPSAALHVVGNSRFQGNGTPASGKVPTGTDGNGNWTWQTPSGGGSVTSVAGTTNRITSSGGTTPAIDISASYVGQSSITTLGTITTGVWNGTAIANANLANSTISGISLGSNLNNLSIAAELISGGATTYNGSAAKSIAIQSGSVTNTMLSGSIDLTAKVTGTLPVANGGTGVTTSTGSTNLVLSASPTFTGTVAADSIKPKLIRFPQTVGAQNQGAQILSFDANSTATANGISWGSTRFIYSDAPNSITLNSTFVKFSAFVSGSQFQNPTTANNATLALANTGTTISRNQADANTALIISNANASSTGNIVNFSSSTSSTAVTISIPGVIGQYGTFTAIGTTGAQTINKPTGVVNFANGATSLVVTNSLCTTSSVIMATIQTNDGTMKSVQCVPASGSFTIYANAAATGTTAVYWEVKSIN